MMKPSDFFVGILDFFAILLPGSAAMYIALEEASARHHVSTLTGTWAIVGFLFGSYVLGHLIFLLGSYLDPLYDRRRERHRSWEDEGTHRVASKLRKAHAAALPGSFSTLKWCRAFISLRSPAARTELDYYEATSKFFRSLVVVFLLTATILFVTEMTLPVNHYTLAAACAILAWLCFLRFSDQRWKLTELTFAYAVLISELKLEPEAPKPGANKANDHDDS